MSKVSVIVPVYNVEEYLDKCLDSIVNQTFKDIEIIIVNDGTKDNSEEIINRYLKKYDNIKYLIKENGGLSSARNYGLDNSIGEYVLFIDSDDYIDSDYIGDMYNKAVENNSDIVVSGLIYEYSNKSEYVLVNKDNIYENQPNVVNRLFKRSIIGDVRFLEGIWYEDLNFTNKINSKTNNIIFINKCYYHYVQRDNSIMNNNVSSKNLDIIKSIDDLKEYYINNKVENYDNIIKYLIFSNVLISAIDRVNMQITSNKKDVINSLYIYAKNNLRDYRKYNFYRNVSMKYKLIGYLNYHKLFNISKLFLNIKKVLRGNR